MQRVWSTYLLGPTHSSNQDSSDSLPDGSQRSLYRSNSVVSDVNSAYSQPTSAHRLLMSMNFNNDSSLSTLSPTGANFIKAHSGEDISLASTTNLSLSLNYIPSKFSEFRNRKSEKYDDGPNLPKVGGGLFAFKPNESRMSQGKRRLRWNKFKWILFGTNTVLTICSLVVLVVCLLTWFDVWEKADFVRFANSPELVVSTLAAVIGILTSLIGWAGILLNNRCFLAWYTFLTWITFAFLVTPGYITYKRRTLNLEAKLNAQWSRNFSTGDRLRVQNKLNCCGYFSPFVEATVSQTCYARSILPGCKGPYLVFQRNLLKVWYKAAFALVPVQILVMVAALLCSNQITYRFGKGMMPEAYRLNMNTMNVIMDNYSNQLANQYGADAADAILKLNRSKSQSGITLIPNTPSNSSRNDIPLYPFTSKYARQSAQPSKHAP